MNPHRLRQETYSRLQQVDYRPVHRKKHLIFAPSLVSLLLASPAAAQNVLLIVADDVSASELSCYDPDSTAETPNICALAAQGVMATQAWSNPFCSPTRATIQTGRYSFRTGIGTIISLIESPAFSTDEVTIPEVLDVSNRIHGTNIANGLIGKWHLGNCLNGGVDAVCDGGLYATHIGVRSNLRDYFDFEFEYMIDGNHAIPTEDYATRQQTQDAIDWIAQHPDPWFLNLAYNSPHEPFHVPPLDLLTASRIDELAAVGLTRENDLCPGTLQEWTINRICFEAMIEAMDREIGRLLDTIDLTTTTVIFVGDNGSPTYVVPFDQQKRAKGSVYQGGVHVPLIFAGAGVVNPNRQWHGLTDSVDLFSTTLELMIGPIINGLPRDGRSLGAMLADQPDAGKDFVLAEYFTNDGTRRLAIRNSTHKLITASYALQTECEPFNEEFYDLSLDPTESHLICHPTIDDLDTYTFLQDALRDLQESTAEQCPTRYVCDSCSNCSRGDNCQLTDLGLGICTWPDLTVLACPEGESIHMKRCPCFGENCSMSASDLTLECLIPAP